MLQIHEADIDIPAGKSVDDLLEDVYELKYSPQDLVEAEGDGKRPYLKGRIGLVDKATANKRKYPRAIMAREIGRLAEDMKARGVYGELDHPGDGKTKMSRVSHFVLGAEITEEGEILGKFEFIPGTTNGDQALAIARAGGRLGVSSRGFGSTVTDHKGEDVVQEDYKLVTWDIVADPANAGAHPSFVVEHKENKKMDLDTLKREHPELVEALTSEIETEARDHAREALREEFEGRLREEGASIREEAVEKARSQLLEDPEVAGAATAIEEIKKVVAPFILSEDENVEVAKLQAKVRKLEQKIADQDEELSQAKAEAAETAEIAKELGYHLYLERELHGSDRAQQVMEMLGDVTVYDTLEALKERVEEITSALSAEDEEREKYEDRIAELEKKLQLTESQRDKALNIGKQFGIRAYIERKVADHPKAPSLRSYLDEASPETKEDVDKLVETFDKANPTSDEFNRIRAGMSGSGPRRPSEVEKGKKRPLSEGQSIMGVPMTELQSRSGITPAVNG